MIRLSCLQRNVIIKRLVYDLEVPRLRVVSKIENFHGNHIDQFTWGLVDFYSEVLFDVFSYPPGRYRNNDYTQCDHQVSQRGYVHLQNHIINGVYFEKVTRPCYDPSMMKKNTMQAIG